MNSLGINGYEQIFLGLYLIAHGLIHIIFLFYFKDQNTNIFTGWSGKSWLLGKILSDKLIKIIGSIIWLSIAGLFVISGFAIADLPNIGDLLVPIIVLSCILPIIAFILFFKDLYPTPYHWILGVVIDLCVLVFILLFSSNIQLLVVLLIVIWLWGMLFHTKFINLLNTKTSSN